MHTVIALKYVLLLSNSVLCHANFRHATISDIVKEAVVKEENQLVCIWNSCQNFDLGSLTTIDQPSTMYYLLRDWAVINVKYLKYYFFNWVTRVCQRHLESGAGLINWKLLSQRDCFATKVVPDFRLNARDFVCVAVIFNFAGSFQFPWLSKWSKEENKF